VRKFLTSQSERRTGATSNVEILFMALVKVVEDIKQATRARVRNASPERAEQATAAGLSRLPHGLRG
jgi:hypothetical protein